MRVIEKGAPILGNTLVSKGVQFGIYSDQAYRMILNIYDDSGDNQCCFTQALSREEYATGHIFHVVVDGVAVGSCYSWQLEDYEGNISTLLMDPYAKSIKEIDEASNCYYSVVTRQEVCETQGPKIPWEEMVIYELHVGAFTKGRGSNVANEQEGTFEGIIAKLPYLKQLGITSIELLPIFKWNKHTLQSKHPVTGKLMEDVWGYNTIAFFALQNDYSASREIGGEIQSFKELVNEAHKLGLEIILDVVYNHTGEGGDGGSTFNFKQLSNQTYYKMNGSRYRNCAGTGNVFNTTHPVVKELVIDSLRYWVTTFGVDGFRFDLASTLAQNEYGERIQYSLIDDIAKDPILASVKLISESWDAKGSYDVGKMPYGFAEWSDCFRDTIRQFIRGDNGVTPIVAKCIQGQDIVHQDSRKNAFSNIHFITAHDGFTLWDVVSYNEKHNEYNGENNRDGNNANYTHNCGCEGETSNEAVIQLRQRRVKNYMCMLLLSYGVPLFVMGDEIGRTQRGNNNAYCQDNEILWMNWRESDFNVDLRNFVSQLLRFRKECHYLKEKPEDVLSFHGVKTHEPDWSYYSCSLAWEIKSPTEHLYFVINNYVNDLVFELPVHEGKWCLLLDTYNQDMVLNAYGNEVEFQYRVMPYSLCIFKVLK